MALFHISSSPLACFDFVCFTSLMTTKPSDLSNLNALAIEACDMWQEHLSTFAKDPSARAELTRFLEPQRRIFADWATMMQQGATQQGAGPETARQETNGAQSKSTSDAASAAAPKSAAAAPGSTTHGDDPLRVAQLALRVAELEKRLTQLEGILSSGPSRRTQRATS
jgi:hypothetical protein